MNYIKSIQNLNILLIPLPLFFLYNCLQKGGEIMIQKNTKETKVKYVNALIKLELMTSEELDTLVKNLSTQINQYYRSKRRN